MPFTTTPSGIRIDHEVVGEGDDLVLVHGITESKQTWDPVLPHLAEGHRLILLDLRGHGQSDVADVHDLESMAADVKAVLAKVAADEADAALPGRGPSLGPTGAAHRQFRPQRWTC